MELLKVTNIGLKLKNGPVVPCIRAVLSDYEGNHTAEEVQELMYSIYENSIGSTTCVGFAATGPRDFTTYVDYPNGTFLYGDLDGFHIQINVDRYTYAAGKDRQNISGNLYYKTNIVARLMDNAPAGETSSYSAGFVVIFTDSDYNLIDTVYDGNNGNCFEIFSGDFPGVTFVDGIPVANLQPGDYFTYEGRWQDVALFENANIKEDISQEINPKEITIDPYNPEGTETTIPGGGGGNHSLDSDTIDIPSMPSLSATDAGFITLFNPTVAQLKELASYMWSGIFDIATYRKLFADPMDCILGLSIVPVNPPSTGTKEVKVGNISTGINITNCSSQYVEVNCGSINVGEYWGAYLDYAPYTKAELYLPYIGAHPIDIDDIMGKTITVVYHVDVLSGSCVAYVKCGVSVLYSFIGQCGSSIPISGNDFTNVINGALQIASAIGSMVATGGASAPMTTAQQIGAGVAQGAPIASTAVNSLKPAIEKSGSVSGTGGMLAIQKPYLIITRPKQAIPAGQNKYMGYPSFITNMLGATHGYTVVESIHLEGLSATDAEIKEIENILGSGVIL